MLQIKPSILIMNYELHLHLQFPTLWELHQKNLEETKLNFRTLCISLSNYRKIKQSGV